MLRTWAFLIVLALIGTSDSKCQLKVIAPAGTFRGKILTSHSGVDYASYRGIPFALPPTGNRRFALPEQRPFIKGVYDASEFGSVCLQHYRGLKLGVEDCLYVNVYTPLDEQNTENDDLKKVLVFIHGGGFVIGSSNMYLPGDLVTRGNLVVVTFNYRLGWMGFFPGNSSSLPGNVGYWDQVLALKWVKQNIRYFGGDPSDVTLSGESAGAMSASMLCLSPVINGLFTKVILLSGLFPVLPEITRTSNELLQIAADKFGCSVDSLSSNEDAVVACLKEIPAEDFIVDFEFPRVLTAMSYGDNLIPRPLSRAMRDDNFLSDTEFFNRDYLVSITNDDGYLFINSMFAISDTTSIDSVIHGLSLWVHLPNDIIKSMFLEYQKLFGDVSKSATAMFTDGFYLNRSLNFLDSYKSPKKNEDSLSKRRAYLMSFDHVHKSVSNQYVLHALDLCYLFDLSPKDLITAFYFLEYEGEFINEDLEMKADYIDLVADFVKTGNPGERLAKEKGVVWPPYDLNRKSYLSLSLQPFVGEDLLGARRVILEKFVPHASWLEAKRVRESKQEL